MVNNPFTSHSYSDMNLFRFVRGLFALVLARAVIPWVFFAGRRYGACDFLWSRGGVASAPAELFAVCVVRLVRGVAAKKLYGPVWTPFWYCIWLQGPVFVIFGNTLAI